MAIRRYNITHLLDNGVRFIPWKLILDYRYILENAEDHLLAAVYIYGTKIDSNPVEMYHEKLLFQPSQKQNNMSCFTTGLISFIDQHVTGIWVEIHNSEFVEMKRISLAMRDATLPDGAYGDGGYIPPDPDGYPVVPFIQHGWVYETDYLVVPMIQSGFLSTDLMVVPMIQTAVGNEFIEIVPMIQNGITVYQVAPMVQVTENIYQVIPMIQSGTTEYQVIPFVQRGPQEYAICPLIQSEFNDYTITPMVQSSYDVYVIVPMIQEEFESVQLTPMIQINMSEYQVVPMIPIEIQEYQVAPMIQISYEEYSVEPFVQTDYRIYQVAPMVQNGYTVYEVLPMIQEGTVEYQVLPMIQEGAVEYKVLPMVQTEDETYSVVPMVQETELGEYIVLPFVQEGYGTPPPEYNDSVMWMSHAIGSAPDDANSLMFITDDGYPEDYICYLPFDDGSLEDKSANNNDASIATGSPTSRTGVQGDKDGAYTFDGNDGFDIANLNLIGEADVTLSIWTQHTNPSGASLSRVIGASYSSGWESFGLYFNAGKVGFYRAPDYGSYTILESTAPAANTWVHIVIACNVNTMKMYKNGELVDTKTLVNFNPLARNFKLGYHTNAQHNLNGAVDNVRFYDRELSALEAKAIYDYEKPE